MFPPRRPRGLSYRQNPQTPFGHPKEIDGLKRETGQIMNLFSILDDSRWRFTPRPASASEYEDSETYLGRVANE
jgi:hypothetical protein